MACVADEPRPSVPPPAQDGLRWLDIHCHTFNGADLPLYEFVRDVKLHQAGLGPSLDVLWRLMSWNLKSESLSLDQELRELVPPPAAVTRRLAAPVTTPRAPAPASAEPGQLLRRSLQALDRAPSSNPRVAETRIAARQILALEEGEASPFSPGLGNEQVAARLEAALNAGADRQNLVTNFMAWGDSFRHSRRQRTDDLLRLYGDGARVFLTPAAVDYDFWLNATAYEVVPQQRVASALAAHFARQGRAVHSFVAFDPWRALDRAARGMDPLGSLREAFETHHAIGVKIYPPMGFRPLGNCGTAFHKNDAPVLGKLIASPRLAGRWPDPGAALDAMLSQLFAWCEAEGVPVMAHCAPSNYSDSHYKDNSHPAYWAVVLRQYPQLRLNLGHFGGCWDLGSAEPQKRRIAMDWAGAIVSLMAIYPNVYADLSYFSPVIERHAGAAAQRAMASEDLRELFSRNGGVLRDRLMYGSDWCMLGQEPGAPGYPRALQTFMWSLFPAEVEQDRRFRWANAARYLGLQPGGPTHLRIAPLHVAAGEAGATALRDFDPNQVPLFRAVSSASSAASERACAP